MRLKKELTLLISSIVFSNIFFINNSFAGYLESKNRYETFRNNSIVINDILEEQAVDIEIEGNSLVNIIDYTNTSTNSTAWSPNYNSGSVNVSTASTVFHRLDFGVRKSIEVGKEYTLFVNITKNTMTNTSDTSSDVIKITFTQDSGINTSVYLKSKQTGVVKYVFCSDRKDRETPYISTLQSTTGEFAFEDLMIVEGNHIDKDIDFFDGIKSSGELQNNNFKLFYQNKNLWDGTFEKGSLTAAPGDLGSLDGGAEADIGTNRKRSFYIPIKPNTTYTISQKSFTDILVDGIFFHQYDKNKKNILWPDGFSYKAVRQSLTFTTDSNARYLRFRTQDNIQLNPDDVLIEENTIATSMTAQQSNFKDINMLAPLRSIPNVISDRIIKKNGIWVLERNCGEIILNGSENWAVHGNLSSNTIAYYVLTNKHNKNISYSVNTTNIFSDKFKNTSREYLALNTNEEGLSFHANGGLESWYSIGISKDKLTGTTVSLFKEYLSKNPIKIIYPLDTPVYEPLNIDLSVSLFNDTTHLFTNLNIPVYLKTTVDRTSNIAKEAVEIAKSYPSVENLSQARYWTNLLKESILKDSFQDKVNNITDIYDLALDKKNSSVNSDIYIKMKNTLSLSLDTNSIVFEGFDNTESIEKQEAVKLTVTSSLPYKVNAYLETPISNADNSNSLDLSILNIKSSTNSIYQNFRNIKTPLTLLDDQDAGVNTLHNIDLRLVSNGAYKIDVYKATIKFEIEQK